MGELFRKCFLIQHAPTLPPFQPTTAPHSPCQPHTTHHDLEQAQGTTDTVALAESDPMPSGCTRTPSNAGTPHDIVPSKPRANHESLMLKNLRDHNSPGMREARTDSGDASNRPRTYRESFMSKNLHDYNNPGMREHRTDSGDASRGGDRGMHMRSGRKYLTQD